MICVLFFILFLEFSNYFALSMTLYESCIIYMYLHKRRYPAGKSLKSLDSAHDFVLKKDEGNLEKVELEAPSIDAKDTKRT